MGVYIYCPGRTTHAPPWWLLLKKPEDWPGGLDKWCVEYEKALQTFLEAMRKCEDEAIQKGHLVESHRLSSRMRDSWQTGDFWLMYAARNNFAFDAVYWEKIDQRFFGTVPHANDNVWDVWQKRLYLLETGEKGLMEEYVDLKLKQRKELLLAWDLDEYSAIWIQRMKEARWKQMDREREDNERLGREDGDVC